jgi:PAS domain S-box-containing protein
VISGPPLKIFIPLLVLLFGAIVISLDYVVSLRHELERNRTAILNRTRVHGPQLAGMAQYFLAKDDLEGAKIELEIAAALPRLRSAVVCDALNRILLSTLDGWRGQPLVQTPLAAALPVVKNVRRSMSGDARELDGGEFVTGVYPFRLPTGAGQTEEPGIGVVVVQFELAPGIQQARQDALATAQRTGGGLLLASLVLWFVLDRKLTARVGKLVATTREIARGNFAAKSRFKSGDELGEISAALDQMADELQRRMEVLSENEELKRTQQALRESERRFRGIFDSTYEFLGLMNTDGTLIEVNRTALDFVGAESAEVIGRPFWDTPWWSNAAGAKQQLKHAVAEAARGKFVRFEAEHRNAAGGTEIVDFSIRPIADETGKVTLLVPEGRPITERKRAEEALRESEEALRRADRRKDEFLAVLAHELRNPLAPIRNVAQLLKLKTPSEAELRRSRDVIARQVDHLTRLIDDLLDLSRITHDRLQLQKHCVQLRDVIEAAVETTRPLIDQQDHELAIELPQGPVYLDADAIRLSQVFSNLLSNAAKYTPRAGRITLAAERDGKAVVVRVIDTGIGIAPEKIGYLFDMFFQADRSFDQSQAGLGIGLSLVKRLVEMHGGTVEVRSAGVNQGSEFAVRLPILFEPAPGEIEISATKAPVFQRVLVADDYADSAATLAELLRFDGKEVEVAYDGIEAVERATTFRPEVVLLDIAMPKLNGYDAARKIRGEPWGRGVVLIAISGWGQEQDRQRSREAGFDGHLAKPVDYAMLLELIASLQANTRPAGDEIAYDRPQNRSNSP